MTLLEEHSTTALSDAYPLSALQAGMVFHSELATETATYHDVFTITLRGGYDSGALAGALEEVAARHPVLRTSFNLTDFAEPLQLVHSEVTIPLVEADLTGETDPDAAFRRWRDGEKLHGFDWTSPPLIRVFAHLLPEERFALTLSFHHAILDGWSVASLTTELLTRYAARLGGTATPVTPPPVTFRDFIAAERALIAAEESAAYWRDVVVDAPVTTVARAPGYPVGTGERMESVETNVPDDVVAGLERVARELRVPLRTVLLTAHLRALGLISGATDVTTGLVTHGRPEHEAGGEVLGLFLNTVPVRVDLNAPSWNALVKRVFDTEVALMPHRQYPLFEIQRTTGRSPLFEALFDYRDFHVYGGLDSGGPVEVVARDFFEQTNLPFAAAFSRSRDDGGLALLLPYNSEQFPRDQVEAFRDRYLAVLSAIAADPAADPRPTAPFTATDLASIAAWNATGADLGEPASLPDLVRAQAARTPDAPALSDGDGWLTYREFAARVDRLAGALIARGAGPESVVGVCLERGTDLVVAVHAIQAAGAAYLPLDPEYPDARLAFMVADAGARLVVTTADHDGRLGAVSTIGPDAEGDATACPAVAPDMLAYVIYTSGSTGTPKGVGISHRAIVNRLRWMQATFPLDGGDRVLHKTPFSFDVSVWELFWPLMVGAGLVVAPPDAHRDATTLAGLVADHGISTVHFVPSMLDAFLDVPDLATRLTGLRRVIASGEALGTDLASRFREALPEARLHNLYGPTEAAVDVTWHPCAAGDTVVPIGRPVANTEIEILDALGERVPVGVPGELCIAGVQLARGYLNRPGLTADRFVPHPFGTPGSRLYRTGDLARWAPGGEIEYLGRIDHQVKIRGFRIELGEIEAALAEQPEVRSAVVVARDDGAGPRLIGYLVGQAAGCAGDEPVDLAAIDFSERLRERLPAYMLPAQYVILDELPVTHNGKLDRAALPAPEAPKRAGYRPPRDQVEAILATVWEQLLGVQSVGINEDFFALGGHSLLALRLAMRVRQEFGRELPVATVLSNPTIRQLAEVLRRPEDMGSVNPIIALRTTGDRPAIFLSHALGGQVFRYRPLAARLGDDQPVYTIPARGLLPGEEPHATLEEMADDYVSYIRAIRPHGPYVLGGFCIGGNIALEVARRLRAAGEEVPYVFPVWSSADEPVVRSSLEDDAMLLIHALAGGVNILRTVDLDELRSMAPDERLLAVINASANEERLRPDTADMEQARRFVKVFRSTAHAVGYYTHEPYDGDVVLLQPQDDPEITPGDDFGWSKVVTGRFAIGPIPGTRFTSVYEPQVAHMAAAIRNWMDHGFDNHTTR